MPGTTDAFVVCTARPGIRFHRRNLRFRKEERGRGGGEYFGGWVTSDGISSPASSEPPQTVKHCVWHTLAHPDLEPKRRRKIYFFDPSDTHIHKLEPSAQRPERPHTHPDPSRSPRPLMFVASHTIRLNQEECPCLSTRPI